jgi:osmoprotectant transport system substrate-binding protein
MAHRAVVLAIALVVWLPAWGCGSSGEAVPSPKAQDRPLLRLGTKNFTEQFILGEIYAQALRARGFRVEVKRDLGSSELVDRALTGGGIDLYAEYTGVIVQEIARQRRRPRSAAETYRRAKAFEARRGFAVLGMSPGFDRLANAVTPATARRHRLRAMADLERLGRYRYGGFTENRIRFQGARGVRQAYGLDFTFVPLRPSLRYEALERGDVDVIDVLTTEAQLADRSRYRVLADPKGIFGYQNIVPVVSRGALRAHGPRLAQSLDAVTARLTNAALQEMNGAVDLRGEEPADVARRFLRDEDLL